MKEFDIISIGGGSGGIATMNRAGEHGARAAVIEEKQLGGTCVVSILRCIMDKHLLDFFSTFALVIGFQSMP